MPTPIPSSLSEFDTEYGYTYSSTSTFNTNSGYFQIDPSAAPEPNFVWTFGDFNPASLDIYDSYAPSALCAIYPVSTYIAGTFGGTFAGRPVNFSPSGVVTIYSSMRQYAMPTSDTTTFSGVNITPEFFTESRPIYYSEGGTEEVVYQTFTDVPDSSLIDWSYCLCSVGTIPPISGDGYVSSCADFLSGMTIKSVYTNVFNTADGKIYVINTPYSPVAGEYEYWAYYGAYGVYGPYNITYPFWDGTYVATTTPAGLLLNGTMTANATCSLNHHRTVTVADFQLVENWNCEFVSANVTLTDALGNSASFSSGGTSSVSCPNPNIAGVDLSVSSYEINGTPCSTATTLQNIAGTTDWFTVAMPVSVASTNTTWSVSNNPDITYSSTEGPYVRPGGSRSNSNDVYYPLGWSGNLQTLTQFESGAYNFGVGSITITESAPPDLSSYDITVTSSSTDSGGKAATTTATLVGMAGWRYLNIDVTATTTATTTPRIYLGILSSSTYGESFSAAATLALAQIVANNTSPSGWFWNIPYDFATGGTQSIVIDLAHGLFNEGRPGEFLSPYETTGVGLNFIQHTVNTNYTTWLTNCGLVLAVDSPNSTVSMANLELVMQADNSKIRFNMPSYGETYQFNYEPECEIWGALEGSSETTVDYDEVSYPYPYSVPIILSRDNKPSASWGDYISAPGDVRSMYVTELISAMNGFNGYSWSLSTSYDLSAVPAFYIMPQIHNIGQGGFNFSGGSYTFDLALIQTSIVDNINWWDDTTKHHYIDSLWWYRYARGLAFNDFTGQPYTSAISLQNATPTYTGTSPILLTGATPITGTYAWSAAGTCDETGFFEILCPAPYIPLNPLYNSCVLVTLEDNTKCYYQSTKYQEEITLREFVSQQADSRYSLSRNAIWTVETDQYGYLNAVLVGNYELSGAWFPQIVKRRLTIQGLSPCLRLDNQSGYGWIFYKDTNGNASVVYSRNQFATVGTPMQPFITLWGEITFTRDPATNSMLYIQTCPASPTDTTLYEIMLTRYDGAGNQLGFQTQEGGTVTGITVNTIITNFSNSGRPYVEVLPANKIVIGYGNQFIYSLDSGNTFYTETGTEPMASTTNMAVGGGIGGYYSADGSTYIS